MKKIAYLLIAIIVYGTSNSIAQIKTHTAEFNEYEQSNSFKGINFGSDFNFVNKKLNLSKAKSLFPNLYLINNEDYLFYDIFKFRVGQAYFTNSGQLYQIVLMMDEIYPTYTNYNKVKERLLNLFGASDREYTFDPKGKAFQPTFITWEGDNIRVTLHFNTPAFDEKKTIIDITILNKKFNNIAVKESFKSNNPKNKIPGI